MMPCHSQEEPSLPFKTNAGRRHRIPKQRFRATNWSEYDTTLRRRGSLTIWFTEAAISAWKAEPRTTRGGPRYSALAINTALTTGGSLLGGQVTGAHSPACAAAGAAAAARRHRDTYGDEFNCPLNTGNLAEGQGRPQNRGGIEQRSIDPRAAYDHPVRDGETLPAVLRGEGTIVQDVPLPVTQARESVLVDLVGHEDLGHAFSGPCQVGGLIGRWQGPWYDDLA
jgi:hypothetical protein